MQETASLHRGLLTRILATAALWTIGFLNADERVLDRAEQIRNLSATDAARGHPVRLRGVVTYYDPEAPDLFIQDESAGIYAFCDGRLPIARGQRIELSGVSDAGDFAPVVVHPKVRTLGVGKLPNTHPGSHLTSSSPAGWTRSGLRAKVLSSQLCFWRRA